MSDEQQAPGRIWLLKSVVSLLGTKDFMVPPELREHAFEYVRAPVAQPPEDAKQLLLRYVDHLKGCTSYTNGACTCGLENTLRELAAPLQPPSPQSDVTATQIVREWLSEWLPADRVEEQVDIRLVRRIASALTSAQQSDLELKNLCGDVTHCDTCAAAKQQ